MKQVLVVQMRFVFWHPKCEPVKCASTAWFGRDVRTNERTKKKYCPLPPEKRHCKEVICLFNYNYNTNIYSWAGCARARRREYPSMGRRYVRCASTNKTGSVSLHMERRSVRFASFLNAFGNCSTASLGPYHLLFFAARRDRMNEPNERTNERIVIQCLLNLEPISV